MTGTDPELRRLREDIQSYQLENELQIKEIRQEVAVAIQEVALAIQEQQKPHDAARQSSIRTRNTRSSHLNLDSDNNPSWATKLLTALASMSKKNADKLTEFGQRMDQLEKKGTDITPSHDKLDLPAIQENTSVDKITSIENVPQMGDATDESTSSSSLPSDQAGASVGRSSSVSTDISLSLSPAPSVIRTPSSSPLPPSDIAAVRNDTTEGTISKATNDFKLRADQLGDKLIPSIANFIKDPNFNGTISVGGLADLNFNKLKDDLPRQGRDFCSVQYKPGQDRKGWTHLYTQDSKPVWPDFTETESGPSPATMEEYLNDLINNPPKDPIPYYNGVPPPDLKGLLHPGVDLLRAGQIRFLNSTYMHAGIRNSATVIHHEDGNCRSVNLVISGFKIWLFISRHHTRKFEEFVSQNWPCGKCNEFVRHLSVLIAPSWLRQEKIDFKLVCAGPGDMVVTDQNEYHQCINFTSCLALSINFLLPGEQFLPRKVPTCSKCGLHGLAHYNIKHTTLPSSPRKLSSPRKRKAVDNLEKNVKTRAQGVVEDAIAKLKTQIKKANCRNKIPEFTTTNPPSPDVFKLAAAIWSREAIRQLVSLVAAWRAEDVVESAFALGSGRQLDMVHHQIKALKNAVAITNLQKFRVRIREYYLAREIERSRPVYGMRVNPKVLDEMAERFDIDKKVLKKHRTRGRKWLQFDRYQGLLCFIFINGHNSFGIKPNSFVDLENEKTEELLHLLNRDHTRFLCAVGKAFEDALMGITQGVKFKWEAGGINVEDLAESDLHSELLPDRTS